MKSRYFSSTASNYSFSSFESEDTLTAPSPQRPRATVSQLSRPVRPAASATTSGAPSSTEPALPPVQASVHQAVVAQLAHANKRVSKAKQQILERETKIAELSAMNARLQVQISKGDTSPKSKKESKQVKKLETKLGGIRKMARNMQKQFHPDKRAANQMTPEEISSQLNNLVDLIDNKT